MPTFPTLFNPDNAVSDIVAMLQSSGQLAGINVKQYRKMRLQPNVDWRTLVTTKNSSGKAGCGVIALEPYATANEIGLSGAIFDWTFPIVSMECPAINDDPFVGVGITAYRLAQLVVDVVHVHADDLYGTFNVDRNAIQDEEEFTLEGCVGKRTNFHIVGKSTKTATVKTIQISQTGSDVTLSCGTLGAAIYYTLDGSWPSNSTAINPKSNLYSTPFAVTTGQIVRATGYLSGYNCSETRQITAT